MRGAHLAHADESDVPALRLYPAVARRVRPGEGTRMKPKDKQRTKWCMHDQISTAHILCPDGSTFSINCPGTRDACFAMAAWKRWWARRPDTTTGRT